MLSLWSGVHLQIVWDKFMHPIIEGESSVTYETTYIPLSPSTGVYSNSFNVMQCHVIDIY